MGPNGSGKSTLSHVIMGRPGYEVLGGSVTLDGVDVLALPPWERAQAGLFLAMQYPTEVPGRVARRRAHRGARGRRRATRATASPTLVGAEAERIGFDERFLDRPLNVDLSGGEKKRNETLQLGVLGPKIAILDELDSGPRRRRAAGLRPPGRGGHQRDRPRRAGHHPLQPAAHELKPDVVHILVKGRIRATGGPELADELEDTGYAAWLG